MPFADGAQAQDEATAVLRRAGLVRVRDDARIEQGRRLEGVFVEEIRPDQPALGLVQFGMRFERLLHLFGAHLEYLEQVSVTTLEILDDIEQLLRGRFGIEPKNPVYDMVGPDLVGRVEV